MDESMSPWTSRYTCPGHMCVPRKPWPVGNEYHSICCCLSGIMYAAELVEGKDRPKEKPPEKFTDVCKSGVTTSLLLRLCESIFHIGMVVILDSGFCVLRAIWELKKRGVFASALIKKKEGTGLSTSRVTTSSPILMIKMLEILILYKVR